MGVLTGHEWAHCEEAGGAGAAADWVTFQPVATVGPRWAQDVEMWPVVVVSISALISAPTTKKYHSASASAVFINK